MKTQLYRPPVYVPHRTKASRVEVGPKCRFLDLNMQAPCAKLLQESGVRSCGIDILSDKYLAGTDKGIDHLVYFVVEGSATSITQGAHRKMRAGDLLIAGIDKGLWLQVEKGEQCRGVWFHIYDTSRWFAIKSAEVIVREALNPASIDNAMEQLVKESLSGNFDSNLVGEHYASIVLLYLDRELSNIAEPQVRIMRHKLFKVWDKITATAHENWTVERIASELKISPGYLHRITMDYHGLSPIAMLRRIRMDRAKALLGETHMTLEQVAAEVGYTSAFSFSNAFRQETGSRPGQFRKHRASGKP